ncbi:MAG: hypothetical protein Q7J45_00955 [bacterium]|nr:hypothetical protein [bacterium]
MNKGVASLLVLILAATFLLGGGGILAYLKTKSGPKLTNASGVQKIPIAQLSDKPARHGNILFGDRAYYNNLSDIEKSIVERYFINFGYNRDNNGLEADSCSLKYYDAIRALVGCHDSKTKLRIHRLISLADLTRENFKLFRSEPSFVSNNGEKIDSINLSSGYDTSSAVFSIENSGIVYYEPGDSVIRKIPNSALSTTSETYNGVSDTDGGYISAYNPHSRTLSVFVYKQNTYLDYNQKIYDATYTLPSMTERLPSAPIRSESLNKEGRMLRENSAYEYLSSEGKTIVTDYYDSIWRGVPAYDRPDISYCLLEYYDTSRALISCPNGKEFQPHVSTLIDRRDMSKLGSMGSYAQYTISDNYIISVNDDGISYYRAGDSLIRTVSNSQLTAGKTYMLSADSFDAITNLSIDELTGKLIVSVYYKDSAPHVKQKIRTAKFVLPSYIEKIQINEHRALNSVADEDLKTYTSAKYGFSFKYPTTHEVYSRIGNILQNNPNDTNDLYIGRQGLNAQNFSNAAFSIQVGYDTFNDNDTLDSFKKYLIQNYQSELEIGAVKQMPRAIENLTDSGDEFLELFFSNTYSSNYYFVNKLLHITIQMIRYSVGNREDTTALETILSSLSFNK